MKMMMVLFPLRWSSIFIIGGTRKNSVIAFYRSGRFWENQLEKTITEAVSRNLATVTKSIVLPHLGLQFSHSLLHQMWPYTRNLYFLGCDWTSKMKKSVTLFSLLLITVPVTLALAHSGATGIVKERMDMFKKNQNNLKAIKSHIRSENCESIVKLADEIRDWAVKMPEHFPEGSN